MPPPLNLSGQRFGSLTVLDRHSKDRFQAWMWSCECDCGRVVVVRGATLKAGRTSACAPCASSAASTTHGMTGTPLYRRWRAMLDRCEQTGHAEYRNYGGRGIRVCDEWRDFENFWNDMGPTFRPHLTLDRIDVNGHYEPGNCRWITLAEQQRNKRTNHLITWRGRTMTIQCWSELLGLKANTLLYRFRRGWDIDRAMTKGVCPDALLEIANGVTS